MESNINLSNGRYMLTSCKDCQERYVGCHSKCEKYINGRMEYEKKVAELKEKRKADRDYNNFKKTNIENTIRKTNWHKEKKIRIRSK